MQGSVCAEQVGTIGVGCDEEVCKVAHLNSPLLDRIHEVLISFIAVLTLPSHACGCSHPRYVYRDDVEVFCQALHHFVEERSSASEAMDQDKRRILRIAYQDCCDLNRLFVIYVHLSHFILLIGQT